MEEQILNQKDPYQWCERQELLAFISNCSFGHLVYSNPIENRIDSLSIPFLIEVDNSGAIRLVGHSRADRLSLMANQNIDVLVLFQGPHGSISAHWHETPMQYPTWNYIQVKAFGRFVLSNQDPILFLQDVAKKFDPDFIPQFKTERIQHIHKLVPELQVFEIHVNSLEGVKKLSQNKSNADRIKMAEMLDLEGNSALADWIRKENR